MFIYIFFALQAYSICKIQPLLEGFLEREHLRTAIDIAWKFVTLPSPVIVCQPKTFDPKIHEEEYGLWDPTSEAELIYSRPVIYRCYEGQQQCKGMVANRGVNAFIRPAKKTKATIVGSGKTRPQSPAHCTASSMQQQGGQKFNKVRKSQRDGGTISEV